MKRPWQIWLAVSACAALVAAAMGWLTVHALRADRERSEAVAAADLEQRVSLALWRMDTKLAPFIAEEAARPHFLYDPYMVFEPLKSKTDADLDRVASPLLTDQDANVILNFNATTGGAWESPQAPPPELTSFACANGMTIDQIESNRGRLDELARSVAVGDLLAQLPDRPLEVVTGAAMAGELGASNTGAFERLERGDANQNFYDNLGTGPNVPADSPTKGEEAQSAATGNLAELARGRSASDVDSPANQFAFGGNGRGRASDERAAPQRGKFAAPALDLDARNSRVQQQVGDEYLKQQRENVYRQRGNFDAATQVIENVSRPLWVGDELLLARRVTRDGATMVQGSWLNWPRLKRELLDESADLVPGADLIPVRPGEPANPTRMLASVPVRLVTASVASTPGGPASPLQWALGVGWAAIALSLVAVAALLRGVLALSERRAAFVSSVTHELRTPLTTFRMYAEMLVRDMVPTAERRREYLQTLRTEAERLTHLVDNVLAYARLERGRKPRRAERTTPAALVDRFQSRLAERAAAAEMKLECRVDSAAADVALLTDLGVVEQILFNLVDNAAKYAGRATDRRIHFDAAREGQFVALMVRDHGPGFASLRAAERSAPFSKSAEEAAESAPGVGLGLALCRRLARELGGQLAAVPAGGEPGAAVTLRLPVDR